MTQRRFGMSGPAVYCFTCPDGRRYIGSRANIQNRKKDGIGSHNSRLREALKKYPAKTWTFEILEMLPISTRYDDRLAAEQRYIEQFRSRDPQFGFNVFAALKGARRPLQQDDLQRRTAAVGSVDQNKIPVMFGSVIRRINNKLKVKGEKLKLASSIPAVEAVGQYFVVGSNSVIHKDVDVEEFARDLGVIEPWEEVR